MEQTAPMNKKTTIQLDRAKLLGFKFTPSVGDKLDRPQAMVGESKRKPGSK